MYILHIKLEQLINGEQNDGVKLLICRYFSGGTLRKSEFHRICLIESRGMPVAF